MCSEMSMWGGCESGGDFERLMEGRWFVRGGRLIYEDRSDVEAQSGNGWLFHLE